MRPYLGSAEALALVVICLEGPSAVGKTTTSGVLAVRYGGAAIPEVNVLFERPTRESATWYFERQVERWAMALEQMNAYGLGVLDGDPFQPLWYNWAFDFERSQPLAVMAGFYRQQIEAGALALPSRYFVLSASEATLRDRRAADQASTGRQRRGFDANLLFIDPQRRYFQALQGFRSNCVEFLRENSVENTADSIVRSVSERPTVPSEEGSRELLDDIVRWLQHHSATR